VLSVGRHGNPYLGRVIAGILSFKPQTPAEFWYLMSALKISGRPQWVQAV
jgi:hypothetical protein